MSHKLSALRAQVLDLQKQLTPLLQSFLGREPLLPGSVYTLRRRCGKPNCRCARGELHASTVLSYRGEGRPRNISLPPEQLREVRELTEDYRAFRKARTRVVRLVDQLLDLLDRIEAARVEQGKRRFEKLRSPSSPRSRR
jgi:hypothetical protein